nr:MAG TPA: Single stranded DNA binding protein [Caudoviricetes sp.]
MENNFSLATQNTAAEVATMTHDEDSNMILDLTTRQTSYCSMVAETDEQKAILYNATNNPDKRIKDCVNEVIMVTDVFVEIVQCHNEETGEVAICPRTVLIDKNGIGYTAVSLGIFSALKKLFSIYGEPQTWKKPIKVKVKQISKGTKNILTLNIVK